MKAIIKRIFIVLDNSIVFKLYLCTICIITIISMTNTALTVQNPAWVKQVEPAATRLYSTQNFEFLKSQQLKEKEIFATLAK